MQQPRWVLLLVVVLVAAAVAVPADAQASPEWNFISVDDTSQCGDYIEGEWAYGADVTVQFLINDGVFWYETVATWGAEVLMDEYFSRAGFADGLHGWGIYDQNSRGLQTMSFADVPPGSTINVTITLWDGEEEFVLDQDFFSFVCGAATPDEETVPVPGCDALINIPATSVVGTFLADTPLYYEPGNMIIPQEVLNAGQSLWVLGKDASGGYYKVLLACGYYWVPVSSIGPNYDEVWNGMPLPTNVVD